jgi:putative transposase
LNKLKAYKFRIYPNKSQETLLAKTFGCARFFWNQQVAVFNSYDKETNPKPEFKSSTVVRKEFQWMQEVSAAAIQQKEIDLKQFKKQFFSKTRKISVNRPKFKKKQKAQSFRLPNQKFTLKNSKLRLEKIGWIKVKQDREILEQAKLMSVTVSVNSSGQYFASILVEQEIKHKLKTNKDVGIDLGIKVFLTSSNGVEISNPKFFSKNQAKLKRLQQHFSRKKKGSKRRDKCKLKIAKLYQKITNQRDFFLHNCSTQLVNNFDCIFIEDLGVKDMLESKLMSKQISDASWSKFVNMLTYKADWYGKTVHKVDRYYASSKTCGCGVKNKELKLSDREWVCGSCGVINQRDQLASKNILKEGRRSLGDLTNVEAKVTKSKKR